MLQSLSPRRVFVGLALLAVISMLFARVYLQAFLGLEACPLCMSQRVFVVLWGVIALLGALHNPAGWGRRVYAGLCGAAAWGGAAIAARHVWLQHLPADQVPACGMGLSYMMETLPFTDVIKKVLQGSGECAEKGWEFLHLSIAGWTLVFFIAMIVAAFAVIRRD